MHLVELHTFLAIIETGSLVKASEQLNVTQSTVTARLKSLENELGQTLINRQKSGATVTAAGERLRRYANTISDLWRQARQETALPDALSSLCNIGCHPDLWPNLGSHLFEVIRTQYPNVALSVWQGSESDMGRWWNDGLIDLCLTHWPNTNSHQISRPMTTDKLILVSTEPDRPLRFDPGYIYVEAGEEFGRWHAKTWADAGTARISFGNAHLGLEYILSHSGTAYLPLRLVREHLKRGRLFWLREAPIFERECFVLANKSALSNWPWFESVIAEVIDYADQSLF
ncbi:MAG: LysR family transcriptional regulator [Pseudomonadota bacterium]